MSTKNTKWIFLYHCCNYFSIHSHFISSFEFRRLVKQMLTGLKPPGLHTYTGGQVRFTWVRIWQMQGDMRPLLWRSLTVLITSGGTTGSVIAAFSFFSPSPLLHFCTATTFIVSNYLHLFMAIKGVIKILSLNQTKLVFQLLPLYCGCKNNLFKVGIPFV